MEAVVREINGFRYDRSKCTNCRCCQLICSFTNLAVFNPLRAFISIDFEELEGTVSFDAGCLACGLCAEYCPFGALVKTGG